MHRDVKPSNNLLDDERRVCVSDFGLAQLIEQGAAQTRAGVIAGTPHYMAPEIGSGAKADRRTDVYSLGVVAYELLTGHPPFDAPSPIAILIKHAQDPMPTPASERVPMPIANVLRRALAKTPQERWPSASGFVTALEGAAAAPRFAPSLKRAATLASVAAAAALVWFVTQGPSTPTSAPPAVATAGTPGKPIAAANVEPSPAPSAREAALEVITSPKPSSQPTVPGHTPATSVSAVAKRGNDEPLPGSIVAATGAVPELAPVQAAPLPPVRELSAAAIQTGAATTPPDVPKLTAPSPSAPSPGTPPEVKPVRTSYVNPVYPAMPLAADLEGEVLLELTVDANGRVTQSKVVRSTNNLFNRAALDAVKQWRYRPGFRAGVPAPFTIQERVSFTIKDR